MLLCAATVETALRAKHCLTSTPKLKKSPYSLYHTEYSLSASVTELGILEEMYMIEAFKLAKFQIHVKQSAVQIIFYW